MAGSHASMAGNYAGMAGSHAGPRSGGELPVAAIVLAAGQSRRLGTPKQLVRLAGEPLVHWAARLALEAGCAPVIVVLGAAEQPCRDALADLPASKVRAVANPDWCSGMSSSLRVGIAELKQPGPRIESGAAMLPASHRARTEPAQSILFMVCDQVRLTVASLERLLLEHARGESPVTAARYHGHLGVPAIFRPELVPQLTALTGDQGARQLLDAWADRAACVDLPEAGWELDTPEDLGALLLPSSSAT